MAELCEPKEPCEYKPGNGNKYPTWKWIVGVLIFTVAVLAGRGLDTFASRFDAQEAEMKKVQERIVRLEVNYTHILDGINDLRRGQERCFGKP